MPLLLALRFWEQNLAVPSGGGGGRAWMTSVIEWHAIPPPLLVQRRYAPLSTPLFSPRGWWSAVIEWWRAVGPLGRKLARQPQPGIAVEPPPPPAPEEICFPPVAAPLTAFSRAAALSPGYSRGGAIAGIVVHGSSSFARVGVEPECDPGTGYGDDYGFDYGGMVDEVCAPAPVTVAAPATAFSRSAALGSGYSREAIGAHGFARVGVEPECDPGTGYGDDYGFDYGGMVDEACAPAPVTVAAPATAFSRSAALGTLGATRFDDLGPSFSRAVEPKCVTTPVPEAPVPGTLYAGAIWTHKTSEFSVTVYPRMIAFDENGTFAFAEVTAATAESVDVSLGVGGAGSGARPLLVIVNPDRSIIGAWVGGDNNMHVQKIDELGVVQFGVNGLEIASSSPPSYFDICTDGDNGCWIAWVPLSSADDLMIAHVLGNGTVEAGFPLELAATNNQCINVQMCADESGGAIVTWGERNASFYDIFIQRVTSAGIQWTAGGVRLTTSSNHEFMASIVSDGLGGAFLAWVRQTSLDETSYDIYAQYVDADGVAQWTANGVPICMTQANVQINPQIVRDDLGGCIVCWKDTRSGNRVYAQRISAGVVQWAANGVDVVPSSNYFTGTQPRMVSDGANGAIIVADATSTTDIRAQRISPAGVLLWDAAGVVIAPSAANSRNMSRVTADGSGGAFAIWSEGKNDSGGDIYAQHVDADGVLQLDPAGLVLASGTTDQSWPDIAVAIVPPTQ